MDGLQLIRQHQIDRSLFAEHLTAGRHLAVAKARHLGPLGTVRTGVILATRRLRSDSSHDRDGRTDDG